TARWQGRPAAHEAAVRTDQACVCARACGSTGPGKGIAARERGSGSSAREDRAAATGPAPDTQGADAGARRAGQDRVGRGGRAAVGERLRRPDRGAQRPQRGRCHREASQFEGLCRVRALTCRRSAWSLSRACRQVSDAAPGGIHSGEAAKRRAVQALGYALAAASGILLALSFPKFGHPALAWVALAPLLVSLAGTTLRRAFILGVLVGILYFTGTLYWITRVMVLYGDLQVWVAVLVNAALILYLSLFPGLFALVMRR